MTGQAGPLDGSESRSQGRLRRKCWGLRAELAKRPECPPRTRRCGLDRFSTHPELVTLEGRAWWSGVVRCRARVCPVCWVSRRAQLAHSIRHTCELHHVGYGTRPLLATLTVRHSKGDSVDLVRGVRDCWRAFLQGKAWKGYRAKRQLDYIVATEVTHGENGWHPHMHTLLLPRSAQSFDDDVSDADWWFERWAGIVERKLGAAHVPSLAHGVDLRPIKVGDYLSKLGLEMADAADSKDSMTPLRMLQERKLDLYLQLCRARHKARDVTWSRSLKWLRLAEPPRPDPVPLLQPSATEYEHARQLGGVSVMLDAVEAAERGGAAAAHAALSSFPGSPL